MLRILMYYSKNFPREVRKPRETLVKVLILSTVKPVVAVNEGPSAHLTSLLQLSTLSSLLWSSVQTVCEERLFMNPAYN